MGYARRNGGIGLRARSTLWSGQGRHASGTVEESPMRPSSLYLDSDRQPGHLPDGALPIRIDRDPAIAANHDGAGVQGVSIWVEKIRAGDRAAFAALFRAYYRALVALVSARIGSKPEAEELIQDIFVRVWERRKTLDAARPIDRYLFRAAKNAALDHLRRRSVMERMQSALAAQPAPRSSSPEDQVRSRELYTAARSIIDGLPERTREAFVLSREAGLSHVEIAELMEVSPKTIEKQIGRALRALRAGLEPYF